MFKKKRTETNEIYRGYTDAIVQIRVFNENPFILLHQALTDVDEDRYCRGWLIACYENMSIEDAAIAGIIYLGADHAN